MGAVASALFPTIVLIGLGHHVRARGWVDPAFWTGAERLTYYLLLPALLLSGLAKARLDGLPVVAMAAALGLGVAGLGCVLALAARGVLRAVDGLDGPGFTSLFQCALRPNTYVGLAIASGLWGAEGVALTAVGLAVVVPLVNVLCVMALLRWAGNGADFRWRSTITPILSNPLILACLGGMGLNLAGIRLPAPVDALLDVLGGASLPLGLLAVGAGLSLRAASRPGPAVWLSILIKMGLLPALVWSLGLAFGLSGAPLAICVIYVGLPVAPASYVLARQMGGDAPLVAAMLSTQTVVAILTMPAWIWLVSGL